MHMIMHAHTRLTYLCLVLPANIMTTLRPFTCSDLLTYNNVNLDPLTETYNLGFYLTYLSRWPEYFYAAEAPSGKMMGYIMGKSEARQNNPRCVRGCGLRMCARCMCVHPFKSLHRHHTNVSGGYVC